MAFQPINYAALPTQSGPENLLSGFNAALAPFDAKRKRDADLLAAELLKLQIQNEPQKYEAERAYKEAQTQELINKMGIDAAMMSAMGLQIPSMNMGGTSGALPNSGSMPMQPNSGKNSIFSPGLLDSYFRRRFNLPDETPEEASRRRLDEAMYMANYNKEIEGAYGTPATVTTKQGQVLGIQQLMPILDELITLDVPGQRGAPSWTSPDAQSKYKDLVSSALETYVSSKGLASNEKSLEAAQHVLERQGGESLENYRNRLRRTQHELGSIYKEITGNPFIATREHPPQSVISSTHGSATSEYAPSTKPAPAFVQMTKDGVVYDIPYEDAQEALEMGYKIGR
jgi:hypothetical protein